MHSYGAFEWTELVATTNPQRYILRTLAVLEGICSGNCSFLRLATNGD